MMWNVQGSGWMLLMMVSNVVFWALVLLAAYLLVTRMSGGRGPQGSRQTAEEVLAQRFARGEIDEDDYRQRLTALRA